METLDSYRHKINKNLKKEFYKSFKEAIANIDIKKFGFIGIIGSFDKKESHDIDILIFPSKGAKLGETIIEIENLYSETEKNLRKINNKYYIAASPKKSIQELVYYLSSLQEGSIGLIPVHSLFFINYRDFKKFNPKDFEKQIKKDLITFYGDFDIIKQLPNLPGKILEPYFFILEFDMASRIKSFPKHLVRASAESLFEYLHKKYGIEVRDEPPYKIEDIHKDFRKLLYILDKKTYEK